MTPEEEAAAAAATGGTAQTTSAPAPGPTGGGMRDPWATAWADPRLQPFKDRLGAWQDQVRQHRQALGDWREALPGNLGFAPRPGMGGMAWDPSKINMAGLARPHFQMPGGFAQHLPWGPRPGANGANGAGGQGAPQPAPAAAAQGAAAPAPAADTPAQTAAKQNMLQRGAGFFGAGAQSSHRPGATAPSQAQGQRWGNWGQNNAGAAEKINKMADANNAAHSAQKRDKAAWQGLGNRRF